MYITVGKYPNFSLVDPFVEWKYAAEETLLCEPDGAPVQAKPKLLVKLGETRRGFV